MDIVRNRPFNVRRGHDQTRPAWLCRAPAKAAFVDVAKRDRIFETHHLESTFRERREQPLLGKQAVGVGNDGDGVECGSLGGEMRQDGFAPSAGGLVCGDHA